MATKPVLAAMIALVALSAIDHDGKRYEKDEPLPLMPEDQANALITVGAAALAPTEEEIAAAEEAVAAATAAKKAPAAATGKK